MKPGGGRSEQRGLAIRSALGETISACTRGVAHRLLRHRAFPRLLRSRALTALGHEIASSAVINAHVTLAGKSALVIGSRTFVNEGTYFDLTGNVVVGSNCSIGHQALFLTASHDIAGHERRAGDFSIAPITIGDGTWIGARVTLLPGVTVGPGCVIAAGAVVTKDLAADGLYAGIPARLQRPLVGATKSNIAK